MSQKIFMILVREFPDKTPKAWTIRKELINWSKSKLSTFVLRITVEEIDKPQIGRKIFANYFLNK